MRSAKWGVVFLLAAWAVPFGSAQGKAAGGQQQEGQTAQQPSQQTQQGQQASGQEQGQKQEDALAEAARQAREKKAQQPKAAKIYDNDNLPKEGSISVVGEGKAAENAVATPPKAEAPTTEAPASEAAPAAQPASGEKPAADEGQKAKLEKELADAKERLQSEMTDLDIATRKLALDQQTYYGKPNFAADEVGAAALKVEEGVVASKKQEVADAQKQVDDLTEKLKDLDSDSAKPSTPQ